MGYAVVYTEAALNDLRQITTYIAADNVAAAERFSNRLLHLAESLGRMPRKGRPVKGWTGVRAIVLSPYIIFYQVADEVNRVEVLRFWHGARNSESLEL
jgi:toxin ParE1/3/4